MKNLITLEIEANKQAFLLELLANFDFVKIQENKATEKTIEMKTEVDKTPKRFTDFTLQDVKEIFELEEKDIFLFEYVKPIIPSNWLKESLEPIPDISLHNEKIRSEAIIYPIILEVQKVNKPHFKFFSGEYVNFNEAKGLKGELDFAFSFRKTAYLETPIFTIVEAKNADITKHWGQIVAQMVGAKEENSKEGNDLEAIFGCVSTGENWRFIKLENNCIYIDKKTYYLNELEKILGIFQYIVDFYKK